MAIAAGSYSGAAAAYEWTCQYRFERRAFGKSIGEFQATRFALAGMVTQLAAAPRCSIAQPLSSTRAG